MPGMGPQRAFGNTGQANDVDLALGRAGVTPAMSQQIVTDQFRQMSVAAACRGEISLSEITPESWIEREYNVGQRLSELGLQSFHQGDVVQAAEGGVGIYDRFIPGGLDRKSLLKACERSGLKLYTGNTKDADYDGDRIPTVTGVFNLDYMSIFHPTNAEQHPYMLPYDQQWSWAIEQGGDGFSTAEEAIYMAFLRPKVEIGYLPYMGGAIRCQNADGSGLSLYVGWGAGIGLYVSDWGHSERRWSLWSLPRKLRVLGS